MSQPAADPQSPSTLSKVIGVFFGVLGGLGWGLLAGVLVFPAARFEEIFERFEIKGGLPAMTCAVLGVSHALRTVWPVVGLVVLAAVAAPAIVCLRARSLGAVIASIAFGMVSIVAVSVALGLVVMGLFLPLVQLMQAVGNKT